MIQRKKLIGDAIPFEAINTVSSREKSIQHGHPPKPSLWWPWRQRAAFRAVMLSDLVDDPPGYADAVLDDPKIRDRAEEDLALRLQFDLKQLLEGAGAPQ